MILRGVPRNVVTEEWLKSQSWALCRSIGADKFFITDGLPSDEYRVASDVWHAAFKAHPKYADWKMACKSERAQFPGEPTPPSWDGAPAKELRAEIKASIGDPPNERRMAIDRTHVDSEEGWEPGSRWYDSMEADPDECLLKISLWSSYYGPGYERGDILSLCAIAEWCEINLPQCTVWYGGDADDVVTLFDAQERWKMRKHLYSDQGRAYFNSLWPLLPDRERAGGGPPPCSLCPGGKYLGVQHGTGRNGQWAMYSCAGCGKSMATEDAGNTWAEHKK